MEINFKPLTNECIRSLQRYVPDDPVDRNLHSLIDEDIIGQTGIYGVLESPIGAISVKTKSEFVLIELLYITPFYRNRDIGSKALKAFIHDCEKNVFVANPYTNKSERFFLKNGFSVDETFDPQDTNVVVYKKETSITSF